MDPITLLAFVPAALALNLTPGADMMFCLGQGLRSGPGPAIAASGGIAMGGFVHALAAGLGLSAVVSAMPGAFDVIRWIGVGYLLWLAWQSLRAGPTGGSVPGVSARRALAQGFIVNLTNPKVIL
ncbi:MAG: LysE family translocator, partial [Thalassovita sp.]